MPTKPDLIMKMNKLDREFGLEASNQVEHLQQLSIEGALAALETFYYGFNHRDLDAIKKIWYPSELIRLNNPVGGIVSGTDAVMKVYDRIFNGHARVWVKFTDIVYYATTGTVVFAGTEIGELSINGETIPVKFRTSRFFYYADQEKRWFQLHHHGSIDDPDLLETYQAAVREGRIF